MLQLHAKSVRRRTEKEGVQLSRGSVGTVVLTVLMFLGSGTLAAEPPASAAAVPVFDPTKRNRGPSFGFDPAARDFAKPDGWQKRFPLFFSDAEFKERLEKVRDKMPRSWTPAALAAAWEKGCPLTRVMLTEVVMCLEGGVRKDTPVWAMAALPERLDKGFPDLTNDLKERIFASAAQSRRTFSGVRDWGAMAEHVAAAATVCEYPKGFEQRERPFVWTTREELPELKKRLEKDPWKTWYGLVVKISDAAMAGKTGGEDEELRLRFPAGIGKAAGVAMHLPNAIECLALRYFVEGKKDYGLKVKELLLKADSWKGAWSKCNGVGVFVDRAGAARPADLPNWLVIGWWNGGAEACAYDLTADLFTPDDRLDVERTFLYRAAAGIAHTGPSVGYQSLRYSIATAGAMSVAVNWKEGADRLLTAMKGYSFGGEGEPAHYYSYNMHTFHNLIGEWCNAYKHMYGKNPLADRADLARHLQHYVSVCGPFGDTPTWGDIADLQAMICYSFWEMNLMPDPVGGMLMWNWQRAGDPRIVMTPAADAKRLTGGKFPCCTQGWSPMHDQYDTAKRETRYPVGEAKLVRAILSFKDFPEPVPPPTTYIAPKDGVVALRSGLEPDDLQMTCYTRRIGALGIHGRRDTLSLLMYAYGSPVIVHPGYHGIDYMASTGKAAVKAPPPPCESWGGFNGRPLTYRSGIWSNSVAAIGVDGGLDGGKASYWLRHQKADGVWAEAIVANSGDGYFGKSDPRGHFRRVIMLVKPDKSDSSEAAKPKGYFVLVDDVLTTKTDADTRWLLQPRGTKVEGDDNTKTWTSYDFLNIPPKPVRLLVHWVRPPESKVEMKVGIFIPFPDPDGEERPFPDIQWKGPGRIMTVLYPLAEGMAAPTIEDLPARKGVKVGDDTIEANAERVTFRRGEKAFVLELKP